jgi:hypothetical protein
MFHSAHVKMFSLSVIPEGVEWFIRKQVWRGCWLHMSAEGGGVCVGVLFSIHDVTFWLDTRDHELSFQLGSCLFVCFWKFGVSGASCFYTPQYSVDGGPQVMCERRVD